jgi:PAS domain S-box-containing protein
VFARHTDSFRISRVSVIVAVIILAATAAPFFFTRHLAQEQDRRALVQRADGIRLNVMTLVSQQRTVIRTLANNLQNENNDPATFTKSAGQVIANDNYSYMALINVQKSPPTIAEASGQPGIPEYLKLPATQQALQSLSAAQPFSTTGLLRAGSSNYIAFLEGSPVAPAGRVIYGEMRLDTRNATYISAILGQSNDVRSALYSGPVTPENLVVANSGATTAKGRSVTESLAVGTSQWKLIVKERHAVADTLTRAVPWIILGAGIIIALLTALSVNGLIRRRDDALTLASERFQENVSILEAAGEAFVSMDTSGKILRWSEQAEQLFGYTRDEVVGLEVAETVVPPELRDRHRSGLKRYLETGQSAIINKRVELDAQHKNGTTFPVEMSIWRATNGGETTFNAIAHDITERRKAAENLAAVTQRALEASQLKSEFLANMSHEIRTPMNGIIGMTSLLLTSKLTKTQREQAQVVQKSSESLLTIINDILDFSKIEAGRLELEQSDFNLRELIDEVHLLFVTLAQQKSLEMRVNVADDVPDIVNGDAGRLRQVLLNIVGNAIKFTITGSVEITCERQLVGDENRLYFEVTDTGIGIAPESRERLFESFVQVDMSSARRHEGTGLGLAISSRLVALMNGEIGVRSEIGQGSTFWFSVVAGKASSTTGIAPVNTAIELGSGHHNPRVLVVEDNLVNQQVAALSLKQLGCEVELVGDGQSAVDTVRNTQFDIIFMDCQMPGMDGYEATLGIRRAEKPDEHNIIIAMTASAMQGDRDRAMQVGMDDYMAKPVKIETFATIINKWLSTGGQQAIPNDVVKTKTADIDLSTLHDLRDRTANNPDIYAGIINTFLKQADELIATIRTAIEENDRTTLGTAAHKLRGSSATVGALGMARLCTDIEVLLADSHSELLPGTVDKLQESLQTTKTAFANDIKAQR